MEFLVFKLKPFRFFYINIGEYYETQRFVVEFYVQIRKETYGLVFGWERGYGLYFGTASCLIHLGSKKIWVERR